MSMHYDSESLVDRGRSPRLFTLLVIKKEWKIKIFKIKKDMLEIITNSKEV